MTSRRELLATALPLTLFGHAREWVSLTHAQPSMGTLFRVVVWARDETSGYRAIHDAFTRAADLDGKLSDYKPESELSALMREGAARPFGASEDLFRVVEQAQRISRETDGLFDISIGPLSRLWRTSRQTGKLPDAGSVRRARELVGYQNIQLDRVTRSIRLAKHGMQLDLGGIAKGYAAEAMLRVLTKAGFPAAMVVAGGEIAAGAEPPGTEGWTIEIDPGREFPAAGVRLLLQRRGASTSGAHEQHVTIDGKSYSHIVDPRTGLGFTRRIAVSVIAPSGGECDAMATAASLMTPPDAIRFLSRHAGVEGRVFLPPDEAGESTKPLDTPGFAKYIA